MFYSSSHLFMIQGIWSQANKHCNSSKAVKETGQAFSSGDLVELLLYKKSKILVSFRRLYLFPLLHCLAFTVKTEHKLELPRKKKPQQKNSIYRVGLEHVYCVLSWLLDGTAVWAAVGSTIPRQVGLWCRKLAEWKLRRKPISSSPLWSLLQFHLRVPALTSSLGTVTK